MKKIRATCDTKLRIPVDELNGIQKNLKMMTKENFAKLRRHILDDGFNFAIHVWKEQERTEDGKDLLRWWVIDGHGRLTTIRHLISNEGYECEPLPCVEIEAPTFDAAKKRVLSASSVFHEMTRDGLYEFSSELGLGMDQLREYDFPNIDLDKFEAEFFPAEKKQVTFEASTDSKEEGDAGAAKTTAHECPRCGYGFN